MGFRGLTLNWLSIRWFYYKLTWCFTQVLRIHNLFREFTKITVFIANLVTILVVFRGFTLNSLYFSQIHFQSTIYFMISLWIHLMYRDLRIYYEFTWCIAIREYTMDSIFISLIHYYSLSNREFTINSLLVREYTMNSIFIWRIHYKFTISNREFTMNSISISWIHC